jgi:hypothetical protein
MSNRKDELSTRFHGQQPKLRGFLLSRKRSTSWVHRNGHWFYCFDHTTWTGAVAEAQRMRQEGKLAGAVSPCGQTVLIRDGRAEPWA